MNKIRDNFPSKKQRFLNLVLLNAQSRGKYITNSTNLLPPKVKRIESYGDNKAIVGSGFYKPISKLFKLVDIYEG